LAACSKNPELVDQYERFNEKKQYLEMFNNLESLDQLSTLPFTLSLIILMMPELKRILKQ
jgi:hypothetical protein